MVGLAVASTVSPHDLCLGLEKPHRLMGSNTALTVRYAPDEHTAAILDSLTALSLRHPTPDLSFLDRQHLIPPRMPGYIDDQQWAARRHDILLPGLHRVAMHDQLWWTNSCGVSPSSTYDSLSCPQTSVPQLHDSCRHQTSVIVIGSNCCRQLVLRLAAAQGGVSAHWAGHDIAATTQQLYTTLHALLHNCREHMPCRACSLLGTTILQSMQHNGTASPVTSTSFTQPSSCLALSRIFDMVSTAGPSPVSGSTNKSTGWQSGCCSDCYMKNCYAQGYPQSISQPAAFCAITHATARNFPSLPQMGNCTA